MTYRTALEQTCVECGKPTTNRDLICDACAPQYAPEPPPTPPAKDDEQ